MSERVTRAVILAGGKGTRLKPYTIALPKPLVPVGDRPILERIITQLSAQGITHITLAVNHLADLLQAFFGNGEKWGLQIDYSIEEKELSTMGPLTNIKDLPVHFLVMNGDVFSDVNIQTLSEHHRRTSSRFTISAVQQIDQSEYGVLHISKDGRLTQFEEKPERRVLVSMGMYIMERTCLQYIPRNEFFGFDHLMYAMIDAQDFPSIYLHDGFWLDIGRPSDYERAVVMADELGLA
jgi:NDP-mannose synthase